MARFQPLEDGSWSVVCAACFHMALILAVMRLYSVCFSVLLSMYIFFLFLKSDIDKSEEIP